MIVALGDLLFNAQRPGLGQFTLPHHLLSEGANRLRLMALDGPGDVSLVDAIRISY